MPGGLTAHEFPLRKVFSSDYEFTVPNYQRPYRWATDQALQLLDDLEETLSRDASDPYFLGSLVLVQERENSYDVIDGQQRLTTLTILFSVLRDLSSARFADELAALVLEPGSELSGIPSRPRLQLRQQDRDFFAKYIQEPGNIAALIELSDHAARTEPQRAIRNNARAIYLRLREWEYGKRKSLATLASTRTYLVLVSTPDLSSAYRIFSVMNARGLDLTPADIFKSRVIGSLPPGSDYAKRWEDAEESLGGRAFTDVFRDVRTVMSGERPRRELLQEFPEQVLDTYLDSGRGTQFIDEILLPYSRAFLRTEAYDFGPGDEWTPVNTWLKRLAMIDNKDWRPVALWALVQHPDDAVFLAEFLRRLERLAAMFLLRGDYTTPRVARYLDLLNELKAGHSLDAASFTLSDDENSEARNALNGEVYRLQPRRARYILLRLDELLADDPGASYSHNVITIEHVLPQTPTPDSDWRSDFTDEERERWVHRLGNLLLLNRRKNSQAQNYDFAKKKGRYFSTSSGSAVFALTTQVLGYQNWTPEIVASRQKQLTSRLIDEWKF